MRKRLFCKQPHRWVWFGRQFASFETRRRRRLPPPLISSKRALPHRRPDSSFQCLPMVVMGGETVQHKPYRHLFEIYPSGRGGGPAHIKPSPPNDDECELVSGLEVCARLPD